MQGNTVVSIINPTETEKKIWEHIRPKKIGGIVRDRGWKPEPLDKNCKVLHECCYGPLDKTKSTHWGCKNRGRPRSEWWVYMMEGAHRILDVGCGLGFPSFYLASCGFEVVGVDASPSQIAACEVYRQQKGASLHLSYQVIEETTLPSESNSFDGATFGNSLECMMDPEAMLREVIRVLKPNSPVALDVDAPVSIPNAHPLMERWWMEVDDDAHYLRMELRAREPQFDGGCGMFFEREYWLRLTEDGKLAASLRRRVSGGFVRSEEAGISFGQALSETAEGEYTEAKLYSAYALKDLLEGMGFTDLKYWVCNQGEKFAEELLRAGVMEAMPDDISVVSRALVRSIQPWTDPPWGLVSCKSP